MKQLVVFSFLRKVLYVVAGLSLLIYLLIALPCSNQSGRNLIPYEIAKIAETTEITEIACVATLLAATIDREDVSDAIQVANSGYYRSYKFIFDAYGGRGPPKGPLVVYAIKYIKS